MKLYLHLLSILPIIIAATPTTVFHQATKIQPIHEREMRVVGEQDGVRESNVELGTVEPIQEFGLSLGKRQSLICTEACGKVDANDCLATLAIAEKAAQLAGILYFVRSRRQDFLGVSV